MKIEELISGKNDNEVIEIEGVSIPISALKNLINDGYVNLKAYKEEKTFSLWGKHAQPASLNRSSVRRLD